MGGVVLEGGWSRAGMGLILLFFVADPVSVRERPPVLAREERGRDEGRVCKHRG